MKKEGYMNLETKEIRLCGDVIFKSVFLREKELLLKMIYDITNIGETMHYEEIITGYELEPYKINGKVNKSDMLIKISKTHYVNIEVNFKHQKNVLLRNMIQLFRICGQITESGMSDNELSLKKVGQLNFNTFANTNNKELQRGLYSDDDGNIMNNLLTFWNIDIVKCYKKVYNNTKKSENLPKAVRWGALLYSKIDNIEDTLERIGDLLTMDEKERLIKRLTEVKKDNQIIQEWMVMENNRMREEDILQTAKEDAMEEGFNQGIEQGIEQGIIKGAENKESEIIQNMLNEKIDYSLISKTTGKTVDEIKEIEKQIK